MKSNTPGYNPRFNAPYNIPDRRAPSEIVSKIFAKASSGRAFDIMTSISQERSLLNLLDPQNRSILHHILLNNDLSKNDKYDLIKQAVELGAPIDIPDSIKGVRPIHLASGQQNRKVVRYLLSKKADPNSKTFNFMTPLHYAVSPESITCPNSDKRDINLISGIDNFDQGSQEFHTDPLFKSVFVLFKNDIVVQKYIKHVSDIFRYRYVYNDQDNDEKDFIKLLKDTVNESTINSTNPLNEQLQDKLVSFKTAIYNKTRNSLSRTNSIIDIKEDTPDGWSPLYKNTHDNKLAILPFENLKDEFDEYYDANKKSKETKFDNIMSRLGDIRVRMDNIKHYLVDSINQLTNIQRVLSVWKDEINAHFNNDNRTYDLINILNLVLNNSRTKSAIIPTANFKNTNNFGNVKVPSIVNSQVNLEKTLEYYYNIIDNKVRAQEIIVRNIIRSVLDGPKMHNHTNDFIGIGDFQYNLINISYALIHFETYIQNLSGTLDIFKSTLTKQKLYPIINYVSTIINDRISIVDSNNSNNSTSHYEINRKDDDLSWSLIHKTNNINKTNIDNIPIVCYMVNDENDEDNHKYVFAKGENPSSSTIVNHGDYLIVQKNPEPPLVMSSIVHSNDFLPGINKTDIGGLESQQNIVTKLDKLFELGDSKKNGQQGLENLVSSLYSSLVELQKKMNDVINIYNKELGYNFTKLFNNNMVDNTYSMDESDPFFYIMFNKIKLLKLLPDSYTVFNDTYKPMMIQSGIYTSENALATVKTLIETYGVKISNSDKTMIVRKPKINPKTKETETVQKIQEVPGIVSSNLTSDTTLVKNGVTRGIPYQYVTNGPNKIIKFTQNINNMPIINSVYDEHISIIKLILLMYMSQQFVDIYDKGTTTGSLTNDEKNVYLNMKNLIDQIGIMSTNSLGIVLAIAVKMVHEIYVSTVNNISNLSTSNYVKYLVRKHEIKDVDPLNPRLTSLNLESLLANTPLNSLDEKSQLIVKPDKHISLRDRDMVLSVMSSGFDKSLDVDMLNIFKLSDNDNGNDTDINRIINYDSINLDDDVCYNVNEDIIADLLSAGANPNVAARAGETPLALAIAIQNESIIETLLRSGSKIEVGNGTNNIYDMCFKQLINLIESSPIMEIDEIDYRVRDHLQKRSGMRSVFSNSKLIMKMTSYMFVHQLTLITSTYPNMWTREGQMSILNMLNLINVDKDFIPLAKMDLSLIDENLKGYSTLNELINEYNKKLIEERETYIRIDNSIKNLTKEQSELLNSSNPSTNNSYRQSEIAALLHELNAQLNNVNNRITDLVQKITEINKNKNIVSNTPSANSTKTAIQGSSNLHSLIRAVNRSRTHNVCDVYDVFFNKIISASSTDIYNNEYNTYIKVWNQLLARPEREKMTDHTQMIAILMQRIVSNGVLEPQTFMDVYQPVCELYDKVLVKYGRDLLELMPYLSKDNNRDNYQYNYVLKQIYCIMHHVFKHTMSINFINTVAQILTRRDKGTNDANITRNVYQNMKSSGFIKYVIVTLPKLVIKIVCKISESEKDPDLSLSVTDVLNNSLDRLSLSTFDGVDKATIEQAKELIVEFFTRYMEAYTAEMYSFMIKQCKIMTAQGRLLRILRMLAPKAILENNSRQTMRQKY